MTVEEGEVGDGGMVTSVDTKHKAGTTDISGFFRTINYRGLDIVLRQYLGQLLRPIILSARNRLYDPQTLRVSGEINIFLR